MSSVNEWRPAFAVATLTRFSRVRDDLLRPATQLGRRVLGVNHAARGGPQAVYGALFLSGMDQQFLLLLRREGAFPQPRRSCKRGKCVADEVIGWGKDGLDLIREIDGGYSRVGLNECGELGRACCLEGFNEGGGCLSRGRRESKHGPGNELRKTHVENVGICTTQTVEDSEWFRPFQCNISSSGL
jgi:hypothetical protein